MYACLLVNGELFRAPTILSTVIRIIVEFYTAYFLHRFGRDLHRVYTSLCLHPFGKYLQNVYTIGRHLHKVYIHRFGRPLDNFYTIGRHLHKVYTILAATCLMSTLLARTCIMSTLYLCRKQINHFWAPTCIGSTLHRVYTT
jgi:hypothetical protein